MPKPSNSVASRCTKAGRERHARRREYLKQVTRWSYPATDAEREIANEIDKIEPIMVERAHPLTIDYMRMRPNECHLNCYAYEKLDTTGRAKMVSGWWSDNDVYILHSVIDTGDRLICITPGLHPSLDFTCIEFRPDPKIDRQDINETTVKMGTRQGVKLGVGIRRNPEEAIAVAEYVRTRLLSGMDPEEALLLDDFQKQ